MPILATASTGATMSGAITSFMDVVNAVLATITGNPTLMVFFCAGIVGIAIGVVRRLK